VSVFHVDVVARNPRGEERVTAPVRCLVDTGSELTWLPAEVLSGIGVDVRRKRSFLTATGHTVSRDVGFAILCSEGYETIDEVVFAQPGDMTLLGVRTVEGFGVMVDAIGHRFVSQATLAVSAFPHRPTR